MVIQAWQVAVAAAVCVLMTLVSLSGHLLVKEHKNNQRDVYIFCGRTNLVLAAILLVVVEMPIVFALGILFVMAMVYVLIVRRLA